MKLNVRNRSLFCLDNLEVLQGLNDECIDLIYSDPPFNKKKIFTAPIGSSAEGASFKDYFREEDLKKEWQETIKEDYDDLYNFLSGIKSFGNTYNYAYLCYMAIRLIEMRRILKDTGSLYLHCDHTMSHYLKILLDCIFGEQNFRNEIAWCYEKPRPSKKIFRRNHDVILFYAKTDNAIFNVVRVPNIKGEFKLRAPFKRPDGTIWEPKEAGKAAGSWWPDIPSFATAMSSTERVGYPTQKPVALLERIIKASSQEGEVVLDPFCGCATTCVAAEKLGRQWVGIDVSIKAYELVKKRLREEVADPEDIFKYENEITYLQTPPKRTTEGKQEKGKFVYVISHPAPKYKGWYKVGVALDINKRLKSYQIADPDRSYKVEFAIQKEKFRECENYIHTKFENKLEWVKADLEELKKAIENYEYEVAE